MATKTIIKQKSKLKVKISGKTKTSKVRFLRLPMDNLTIKILSEVQAENPYFTELDSLRYIIGKQIKTNSQEKLLKWLKLNVGSKQFPVLSEEEIFKLSAEI